MKPPPPFARGPRCRFPLTDVYFQSSFRDWRGSSWPGDEGDDSAARRFNRFNRDLLREARRERQHEMVIFVFIMLIAAWPVVAMAGGVVKLLLHGHPFGW